MMIMKCLLFFALLAIAFGARFAVDAGAVLVTDADFDSVVLSSGKNVFVKFLAPW